jgi:endonuclease G
LAEAKRIDRDYSNRNGFDSKFVPGIKINLGEIIQPVKSKIAALIEPAEGRAFGELVYQNFSSVMHKVHHIAVLTATNIDGKTYIAIDRKTGEPSDQQPGAEGDTWYKDPRINESLTLTNDFYSQWSHIFDRGHLTRRNDPTWGPNAARANVDTFHFTNCSPQHWKFNQSIEFWQGLERYVLEQGLWETGLDKRLSVLQGPLYDAPQPLFADDVEIPNAFWKIVTWKGKGGLKAVALVADQSDLLSITRQGGGQPDETARANVTEFRTTVADIAKRSGLDLDAIAPHDTAKDDLPHVGEAQRKLTSFDQIKVR